MTRTWMCADWHLGHMNILRLEHGRPGNGPTVEDAIREHDEILIDRHNALVGPDDVVWVLGDAAMGDITASLANCARMNGRKFLVCGNHDRPAMTTGAKRDRWIQRYKDEGGFAAVYLTEGACDGRRSLNVHLPPSRMVQVSHYPYQGDSQGEDRYVDRRPRDDGEWLVHGHVHSAWKTNGRMINCGVDVWDYQPVPTDVIVGIIDANQSTWTTRDPDVWQRATDGSPTPG